MCIIAALPPNIPIEKSVLRFCNESNPDGIGYAYPDNGKLIIKKGYFKFKHFWRDFQEVPVEVPRLIHFRIASSGKINQESCHPFRITENVCLAHNGILDNSMNKDSAESDTMMFVRCIVRPILEETPDLWLNPSMVWVIKQAIDSFNKMVFLDNLGNYRIINEAKGEWSDGVWFSNISFREARKKKQTAIYQNSTNYYNGAHHNPNYTPTNTTKLPEKPLTLQGIPAKFPKQENEFPITVPFRPIENNDGIENADMYY